MNRSREASNQIAATNLANIGLPEQLRLCTGPLGTGIVVTNRCRDTEIVAVLRAVDSALVLVCRHGREVRITRCHMRRRLASHFRIPNRAWRSLCFSPSAVFNARLSVMCALEAFTESLGCITGWRFVFTKHGLTVIRFLG